MPRVPKVGRTTHEIASYPWPVVTKTMLGDSAVFDSSEQWNELTRALVAGRIHLKNAELAARKARLEALKDERWHLMVRLLEAQINWIEVAQKEWPLSVVGE